MLGDEVGDWELISHENYEFVFSLVRVENDTIRCIFYLYLCLLHFPYNATLLVGIGMTSQSPLQSAFIMLAGFLSVADSTAAVFTLLILIISLSKRSCENIWNSFNSAILKDGPEQDLKMMCWSNIPKFSGGKEKPFERTSIKCHEKVPAGYNVGRQSLNAR